MLVPSGGPPRGVLARPGDVIRNLDAANAWLTLLNVEDDPGMAELMHTYLDELESGIVAKQGKMRNRVAFVFVSSPNSVTPVHFDIEHSLLMQVSGRKTVSIGRFESAAARRHEIDRYWDGSHGRIETQPPQVAAYTLTPGRGVYIPPGTPHWVHNGPDSSLSVTLTYFTAATVRENRIEDFNSLPPAATPETSRTGSIRHRGHRQDPGDGSLGRRTTSSVRCRRDEASSPTPTEGRTQRISPVAAHQRAGNRRRESAEGRVNSFRSADASAHAHDRRRQHDAPGRAVEGGVAVTEDPPVCGHQPVAVTAR